MSRVGIAAVAAREIAWIRRDPVALLLTIFAPLLAFSLISGTFSSAVIRKLHIDVVDADRTATSAALIQTISAAPGVSVALRSTDLTGAMHAIRSGVAIDALYIPEDFERDLLANRRPQVVNFYNRQLFAPGNIAASGVQAAVAAAIAALPKQSLSTSWRPGPLVVEQYVLRNPALNYIQFLARSIMPTVLHVMVAIAGAFSVGSEFGRRRDIRELLEFAGGSPLPALAGKFAPYLAIFLAMMVVGSAILHAVFHISFRGDPVLRRGVGNPADRRLLLPRRLCGAARQESCCWLVAHRHRLLARVRLRGRRLSGDRDERLRARMGIAFAAALVSAGTVRPGRAWCVRSGLAAGLLAARGARARAVHACVGEDEDRPH